MSKKENIKKMFSLSAMKQKKGQAGLSLLLTVITMLFTAGLLVMTYALVGGELQDSLSSSQNTSKLIINDTVTALADVPSWFPTIIVLTVVVVLILLIVIIIQNLRASGLMGQGGGA